MKVAGRIAIGALLAVALLAACRPPETTPAAKPAPPSPAVIVAPTQTLQPLAPVSGGGVNRDALTPVVPNPGVVPTVSVPKPGITLVPREPPAPVAGPDLPGPGAANPIGPYLTPLPKPNFGQVPAGAGGAAIPLATTGPSTQLQPLPDAPAAQPTAAEKKPGS